MACNDCYSGFLHEGAPAGQVEMIHGRRTYVAGRQHGHNPKAIIVVISDMFGMESPNTQLLADRYAASGKWLVYLPDFMDGRAVPMSCLNYTPESYEEHVSMTSMTKTINLIQMVANAGPSMFLTRSSVAWPRVVSFFSAVRDNEAADIPIGASGFCWGGKHAIFLAHDQMKSKSGKSLVDAVFAAHPSFLTLPADLTKVVKPLSVALADNDHSLSEASIDIIKKTLVNKQELQSEVVVFQTAVHGFALRNDLKDEKMARQVKESEDQATGWFQKFFGEDLECSEEVNRVS